MVTVLFTALDIDFRNGSSGAWKSGAGLVSIFSQPSSMPSRMIRPASSVWKVPRSRSSPVSVLLLPR